MPAITAENAHVWQGLADSLGPERPGVGKRVTVHRGKHRGKTGIVRKHQVTKFGTPFRYMTDAQMHLNDMVGKHGYCVQVETDDGTKFWTAATNVNVVQ